jgi:hypothetical protein
MPGTTDGAPREDYTEAQLSRVKDALDACKVADALCNTTMFATCWRALPEQLRFETVKFNHDLRYSRLPMEKRTYRWYTTHNTYAPGADYSETSEMEGVNLQKGLDRLDILDKVPTLENFKPLVDMYSEWWKTVEVSWKNYENGEPHLVTLHWILYRVLQDPSIDPEILRYTVKVSPKNVISVVYNPNCPEDVLVRLLEKSGTKEDPTKNTKGGEIGCFILHNKKVSSKVVDLIARKTKRASVQRDVIRHPNVSRETLVRLSKEGRNPNVQKDARNQLVERGFVKVD